MSIKQLKRNCSQLEGMHDGDKSPFLFFFLSLHGWDLESCIVVIINFVPLVIASLYNLFYFLFTKLCTFTL